MIKKWLACQYPIDPSNLESQISSLDINKKKVGNYLYPPNTVFFHFQHNMKKSDPDCGEQNIHILIYPDSDSEEK
ncbi:hypothetical protein Glove_332g16 [Diversispora epigaea]|uniref:Uncharacterized protein n=1 Tax=Diversispora epigaea TaxID=1348612 RepID=A0A397HJN4_9GLOM|nr:hypothetical protein Glove_332g16 [Diversispora epigaea]